MFAERERDLGAELILVQCKRYGADNPVGLAILKQLYADLTLRNASRGLVVTTSVFTRPALQYIESVRYRLWGQDMDHLKAWLRRLREDLT